eukprot:365661-Chlamydomonas_euryale.AAC.77
MRPRRRRSTPFRCEAPAAASADTPHRRRPIAATQRGQRGPTPPAPSCLQLACGQAVWGAAAAEAEAAMAGRRTSATEGEPGGRQPACAALGRRRRRQQTATSGAAAAHRECSLRSNTGGVENKNRGISMQAQAGACIARATSRFVDKRAGWSRGLVRATQPISHDGCRLMQASGGPRSSSSHTARCGWRGHSACWCRSSCMRWVAQPHLILSTQARLAHVSGHARHDAGGQGPVRNVSGVERAAEQSVEPWC